MKHDDDDDDLFDERGVMRRSGTYRVPVQVMDSEQRETATSTVREEWIREMSEAWRQPTSSQSSPIATAGDPASAYAESVRQLENAWRTP